MWTCFSLSRISVKWQFSVPSVLKELQLPLKKIHATETMQTHQKTRNNTLITFRDCQDHFRQNDLCTYKTLKGNVEFAHCKSSHIFLTMTCAKLLLTTFFREKKNIYPMISFVIVSRYRRQTENYSHRNTSVIQEQHGGPRYWGQASVRF